MSTIRLTPLLQKVLLLDAGCTAVTGVLLTAGHQALSALLGLPAALLLGAGLFCLAWAAALGLLARRRETPRAVVWTIIVANLLWTIDSILLPVLGWVQPTTLGTVFLVAQAFGVAVFAELQWWALRRASPQRTLRAAAA